MSEDMGINISELEQEIRNDLNECDGKNNSIKEICKKMTEYYGTSSCDTKNLMVGTIKKKGTDNNGYNYYEVQPIDYLSGETRKAFLQKNLLSPYRNYDDRFVNVSDLQYFTFSIVNRRGTTKIEIEYLSMSEEQRSSDIERILKAKTARFTKINEEYQNEYDKARTLLNIESDENLVERAHQTREMLKDIDSIKESVDDSFTKYERINSIKPEIEELISKYDEKIDEIIRLKDEQKEKAISRLVSETQGLKINNIEEVINQVSGYIEGRGFSYSRQGRIIRRFVSALLTDQLIILSGPPGTGKTSLPQLVAEAIDAEFTKIAVQSNWTDAQDLIGFYDYREKKYVSTTFLDAIIDASEDPDRIHIILLDEMNIARIEYYFSMFLSSMDRLDDDCERKIQLFAGKEEVDTTSDRKVAPEFVIPDNVQFVGTVNMDETTNKPSPKVLNRSYVIEILPVEEENDKDETKLPEFSPALIKPFAFITARDQNDASIKTIDAVVKQLQQQYGVSYSSRNQKNAVSMLKAGASDDDIVIGMILPGLHEADSEVDSKAELPSNLLNSKKKLELMTADRDIDYWRY